MYAKLISAGTDKEIDPQGTCGDGYIPWFFGFCGNGLYPSFYFSCGYGHLPG